MALIFCSNGITWTALLGLLNLLIVAVANDGSVPNSSSLSLNSSSSSGSRSPLFPLSVPAASLVKNNVSLSIETIKPRISSSSASTSTTENSSVSLSNHHLDSFEMNDNNSFLTSNRTIITAQINSNALLPCMIRSSVVDGITVSWIRRKDYHLLTVGLQTYSSDNRFQVIHAQGPEDWTLRIKYVQPHDAGIYECSISTHPPSSIFVTLNAVEARAEITGGPEKYIKSGSTLRLICEFKQSTEQPDYVFWFQGLRMINYDPNRNIEVTQERYSSTLVLNNVDKSDTANYSCVPSNASPASIFVHIINGENPAAMQHGSHSTTCVPCPPLWALFMLLLLTLQHLYFRYLNDNPVHNYSATTTRTTSSFDQIIKGQVLEECHYQNTFPTVIPLTQLSPRSARYNYS